MRIRSGEALKRWATALLVAGLSLAGSASAMLLSRGIDLVYDDVLDITWTRNANLPGSSGLTWAEANAWAADLVFAGFDDWRLPYVSVSAGAGPLIGGFVFCNSATELQCRDDEMGYMFYYNLDGTSNISETGDQTAVGGEQLTDIQPAYWSGTREVMPVALDYDFALGLPGAFDEGLPRSAWAVRAGDVAVVPEPASALLIGAVMLGLGWSRRSGRRR